MNVLQRPRDREFCGTMQDYVIDTEVSITFAVEYGGKRILDEDYVPDADYLVRIRKLGKFCENALWSIWCAGEISWQNSSAGVFSFFIDGVLDVESFVMYSTLQTTKDAYYPGWLSEVNQKVVHKGCKEYLSGYLMPNNNVRKATVTGYDINGSDVTKDLFKVPVTEGVSYPVTIDVSLERIMSLFPMIRLQRYIVKSGDYSFLFHVDSSVYMDKWCFRFKNVYGMPETVTAMGGLSINGGNESDAAVLAGVERKFGLKVTDEYTVNSGVVMLQSDYKLWHNLLNAQEADILVDGEWLPIVISKQKYEREFRRSAMSVIEFSFRMADPDQNNLIHV